MIKAAYAQYNIFKANPAPSSLGSAATGFRANSRGIPTGGDAEAFALAFLSYSRACLNLRARALAEAMQRVKVFYERGYKKAEVEPEHWLVNIVYSPNKDVTTSQFWRMVSQWYDGSAGAFIYAPFINHRTGEAYDYPVSMYVLQTGRLQIVTNDYGIAGYVYTTPSGSQMPIDRREVFSFRDLQPSNRPDAMLLGVPKVRAIAPQLKADRQVLDYVVKYLDDNEPPPLILHTKETFTEDTFAQWKERWNKTVPNAKVVALLEGGMNVEPLTEGDTAAKAAILGGGFTERNMKIISGVLGVPMGLVFGEMNNSALTTQAADALNDFFQQYTLQPDLTYFCEELTRFAKQFDKTLLVEHQPYKRNDPELAMKQKELRVRLGQTTPNEENEAEGLPTFAGGDRRVIGSGFIAYDNLFAAQADSVVAPQEQQSVQPSVTTEQTAPDNAHTASFRRMARVKSWVLEGEWTEEQKAYYYKRVRRVLDKGETGILRATKRVIAELEDEVLRNVEKRHTGPIEKDAAVGGALFDVEQWVQRFEEALSPEIAAAFTGSLRQALTDIGESYANPAVKTRFDEAIERFLEDKNRLIKTAPQTIFDSLNRLLLDMKDKPASEIKDAIAGKFSAVYSETNAKRIAQTVATYSNGLAQKSAFTEFGYKSAWLHAGGGAQNRLDHVIASGMLENDAGYFEIGGESLRHPGDGSAKNSVNCYCVLRPRKVE